MSDANATLKSTSFVEITEIISEGEIEGWANGTPEESIYFNNTPVKKNGVDNFEGVTFLYTKGTQDQAYLPSKLDGGDSSVTVFSQVVTKDNGAITKTTQNPLINIAKVMLRVNSLFHTQSDGDSKENYIEFKLEVKAADSPAFVQVILDKNSTFLQSLGAVYAYGNGLISGKTSVPYERTYILNMADYGSAPYDIKLTRITDDRNAAKNSDILIWQSLEEVITSKLRYPNSALVKTVLDGTNFTQLPVRGFEIYGIKCLVPSNYDPVNHTYSGAWDGSLVKKWTNNPAWVYYDMITNPRYGLGSLLDVSLVNKSTLYAIGQYCDEPVDKGDGTFEPRFTCNLYLQSAQDAYKVISDLASVFRGMIYYTNGEIYTVSDRPGSPVAQYTPANVKDGIFTYIGTPRTARYTAAIVAWNDPVDNFRQVPEYVQDDIGIARYGLTTKETIAVGCLSRTQAHRVGKYVLLTSRMETDVVTFVAGLDAMFAMPGNIIKIYDPLKSSTHMSGGRLLTTAAGAVTLDRDITLQNGETYTLSLVQPNGVLVEKTVTLPAGVYPAGTAITFTTAFTVADIPLVGSVWVMLADSMDWTLFRVLGITEEKGANTGYYGITAAIYDPDKLEEVDSLTELSEIPIPNVDTSGIKPVSGLSLTEGLIAMTDMVDRYIEVSWTPSPGPYLKDYVIEWLSPDGFQRFYSDVPTFRLHRANSGIHSVTVFARDTSYKMSTGLGNTIKLEVLPPIAYVEISGLELKGQGLDTEFAGKDPTIAWRATSIVTTEVGDEPENSSFNGDPWLTLYEIRVFNADGSLLRVDTSNVEEYTYYYSYNVADGGPYRDLTFTVAARDAFGRVGHSKSITVHNEAPVGFSALSLKIGLDALFLDYIPPDDIDYVATRAYLSTTQGFIPGTGNIVYEGKDWFIPIHNLAPGTYYIRLEGVDEFGPANVFTSELSATVDIIGRLQTELAEAITEGWLYGDLQARIDLIDGIGPGSVTERIDQAITTKIFTYRQDTPPDPATTADKSIWFNSSDNNHPYVLDLTRPAGTEPGHQWVDARDTAATGVQTFFQATAPIAGMATGDLWFDTSDNDGDGLPDNTPHRYNGLTWDDITSGLLITTAQIVDQVSTLVLDPDTGVAASAVAVASLETTVTEHGDTLDAQGTLLQQVQATAAGASAAIAQESVVRASTDGALSAEYTLKLDVDGRVAGMGVAVENDQSGAITSEVIIVGDKFAIALPVIEFVSSGTFALGQFIKPTAAWIAAHAGYQTLDPKLVYQVKAGDGHVGVNEPNWPLEAGTTFQSGTTELYSVPLSDTVPFIVGTVDGQPAMIVSAAYIGDATIDRLHLKDAIIGSAQVEEMSVSKLSSGIIDLGASGYMRLGDSTFEFSSILRRLTITDEQASPKVRLRLGRLGGTDKDFGIEIFDENGNLLLSSRSGFDLSSLDPEQLGVGAMAYLDALTADNIGVYIAEGAIGNALIANVIQSLTFNPATGVGWKLDKAGVAQFGGIVIYDENGDVVMSSGAGNTYINPDYADVTSDNPQPYNWVTGTKPPIDADKTGANIALGITGQGALATRDLVTGTYIANLTVNTINIAGNAVTFPASTSQIGPVEAVQNQEIQICFHTFTCTGARIFASISAYFTRTDADSTFEVRLYIGGVQVSYGKGYIDKNIGIQICLTGSRVPVAGPVTVTATLKNLSNSHVQASFGALFSIETKK